MSTHKAISARAADDRAVVGQTKNKVNFPFLNTSLSHPKFLDFFFIIITFNLALFGLFFFFPSFSFKKTKK